MTEQAALADRSSVPLPDVRTVDRPASTLADARRTPLVRVLHVVNGEHYSGAERVQDLLAGFLPACGYDVGFACVKPGRFPQARKFQTARLYELPMSSRFDFACGRKLAMLARDEDYALIHAHTPRS